MSTQEPRTATPFALAVAAEIRAHTAAMNVSGQALARTIGRSQNYVAERLRDEKPFTVDDLAAIAGALDTTPEALVQASARWLELQGQSQKPARGRGVPAVRVRKGGLMPESQQDSVAPTS